MIEIGDPSRSFQEYPGPILLLAGPGTGKTWQLAMRVKYLVEQHGATPDEMTVITFTNEAARNMRDRLAESDMAMPVGEFPALICTMHSLGNRIIGSRPEVFDLPEDYGVLYEDAARRVLLEDAATMAGHDRESWILASECRKKGSCHHDDGSAACRICHQYKTLLRKCGRVDYDDQIMLACEALKADEDLLADWQQKARYLLVDEYQDINEAQCELIQLLSAGHRDGLFCVGDDDQSIYSFRGGSPRYIKDFGDHFGDESRIGRLQMSWRCPEHILLGARAVIATYYPESVPKPDPTFSGTIKENNKIVFHEVPSEEREAAIVAAIASEKLEMGHSVTILIPHGKFLPAVERALRRKGVDFTYKRDIDPSGIVRFAVLADWVDEPHDNVACRYLLDLAIKNHDALTRKMALTKDAITAKRIAASELVARLWDGVTPKASLYAALCCRADENPDDEFVTELRTALDEVKDQLTNKGGKRTELPSFLASCGLLVAPAKNAAGMINAIRDWREEQRSTHPSSSLQPVGIYNMPSAKGLQADTVIVIGLSEGVFPGPNADLEESSRLFYVAMTRAKSQLHLFSARTRPGSITFHSDSYQLKRSRFIDAIPAERLECQPVYGGKKRSGIHSRTPAH